MKSGITITGVRVFGVAIPRRRRHAMAFGVAEVSVSAIVRIETSKGIAGLGEARVMKDWGGDHRRYYGETPQTVAHVVREHLAPVLQGQDPFMVERLQERMNRVIKGHPYAKAAVNMALYDIKGRALGVPAYELLGGLVRERIAIIHSLGIMEPDAAAREAADAVEEGITMVKVKVGLDVGRDIEAVAHVRRSLGDSADIMIDANQGYRDAKTALLAIRGMEPYRLAAIEQPVEGLDEMARVTAAVNVPVMADESAWTPRDILEIARSGAADYVSIYVAKAGGMSEAYKAAAVAEAAGIRCNINGSGELGIGSAANLHAAASMPHVDLGCVFPVTAPAEKRQTRVGGRSYLDDIVKEAADYSDGYVYVNDRPGLGVELDDEKVNQYWHEI